MKVIQLFSAFFLVTASCAEGFGLPGRRGGAFKKSLNIKGGGGSRGKIGGNGGSIPPVRGGGAGASDADGEKKGLWDSYLAVLESDPLPTKAVTSLLGFLIGDLLTQFFIDKDSEYNPVRTLRMAAFGLLIHGPTGHWFYGKLDGAIVGTSAKVVASKVAIDQCLWNPIFGVMFLGFMGITTGLGVDGTITKIKNDLYTACTGSLKVWPIVHAIGFRFVPTEQRLLYINSVQIGYNMFLSIIGNK